MGGLLSAFKKQTGQDYNGEEQQTNMLSSLAHQVRCNPAPLYAVASLGCGIRRPLSNASCFRVCTKPSLFAVTGDRHQHPAVRSGQVGQVPDVGHVLSGDPQCQLVARIVPAAASWYPSSIFTGCSLCFGTFKLHLQLRYLPSSRKNSGNVSLHGMSVPGA